MRSTVLHLKELEPVRFNTVLQLTSVELVNMLKQCQISEQLNVLKALEFYEEVREVCINGKRIVCYTIALWLTQPLNIIPGLHE